MGAIVTNSYSGLDSSIKESTHKISTSVTYDAVGRAIGSENMSESDDGMGNTTQGGSATGRTYDVENHVVNATVSEYGGVNNPGPTSAFYTWGVNGHPLKIGSGPSVTIGQTANEMLFWDGDSLMYTMRQGANDALDDIKIGSTAEVTNAETKGYAGVTFYDRGHDGSVAYCHNETGVGGTGNGNPYVVSSKWGFRAPPNPCAATPTGNSAMKYPKGIAWGGGAPGLGQYTPVGAGWTIGMARGDGINDGISTIQGVRSYDPTTSQWTTPDAYSGSVDDPMSQKAYAWNGNNPVGYSDPSGYDPAPENPGETQANGESALQVAFEGGKSLDVGQTDVGGGATTGGGGAETGGASQTSVGPAMGPPGAPSTPSTGQTNDYTALRVNLGVPMAGFEWLGVGFELDETADKHWFVGGGPQIGKSLTEVSGSITNGFIFGDGRASASDTYNFINGWTINGLGAFEMTLRSGLEKRRDQRVRIPRANLPALPIGIEKPARS